MELGHVDQARSTWDGMKDKDKGSNASYETKSPIIPKLNNFTSSCTPSKSSLIALIDCGLDMCPPAY